MNLKPVMCLFIECENGDHINIANIDVFRAKVHEVMAIMSGGNLYCIQSGFENKEQSEKYIEDLLMAYRKY
jgi:hypothetical protein